MNRIIAIACAVIISLPNFMHGMHKKPLPKDQLRIRDATKDDRSDIIALLKDQWFFDGVTSFSLPYGAERAVDIYLEKREIPVNLFIHKAIKKTPLVVERNNKVLAVMMFHEYRINCTRFSLGIGITALEGHPNHTEALIEAFKAKYRAKGVTLVPSDPSDL